jgi:hypothetical protein
MGTFDDPALRQDYEPRVDLCGWRGRLRRAVQGSRRPVPRAAYDFDANMVELLNVASAVAAVRAVGVELFKPGRLGTRLRNNSGGGIPILYARGGYRKGNDQTHRIDDEVRFRPLTFLAASKPLAPPCGEIRLD